MEISKEFKFEASHVLPNHPGKCSNLHGHSWVLTVTVKGPVDEETGMVMDYGDLKKQIEPIINDMDHAHLGAWETDRLQILFKLPPTKRVEWLWENPDFNPTSENLLIEIGKQIVKRGGVFSEIRLNETCTVVCYLDWEEFNEIVAAHR